MLRRHARPFTTEPKKKVKSRKRDKCSNGDKEEAGKDKVFDLFCDVVVKDYNQSQLDSKQTQYSSHMQHRT